MTFFSQICRKRLAADLSQEALSGAAGLHRTYVGLLERGLRMPSILVAKQVAEALGMTMGELLAEVDREEVDSPARRSTRSRADRVVGGATVRSRSAPVATALTGAVA